MQRGTDYIGVGVGVMIFDEQGRLLLTKRGQAAKNERGMWEVPGGTVDLGERRGAAAIREAFEELGVDVEIIEELHTIDHLIPDEGQHWVATPFLARIADGQTPSIMEPEKCEAIEWFALDALPSPLSITTRLNLEVYERRQK